MDPPGYMFQTLNHVTIGRWTSWCHSAGDSRNPGRMHRGSRMMQWCVTGLIFLRTQRRKAERCGDTQVHTVGNFELACSKTQGQTWWKVNLLVKQHALSCAIKVCMTLDYAYVLFSNRSACYEASNIFGEHSLNMAGTTVPLSRFLSAVLRATWTSCWNMGTHDYDLKANMTGLNSWLALLAWWVFSKRSEAFALIYDDKKSSLRKPTRNAWKT